jgi:2-polyprenyl-3-methyl-5-hydroxy-6-metoxy-1,4-benzoquinol methylase
MAVDISPNLLEKAMARNLPTHQVRFINKRFEDCNVDGPFDAVIGSSVLHHLDLELSLVKIFELLKPGGIMSFAEPNMLNPQVFMERKFRQWFPNVSPDETAFVRWKLQVILLKTGFEKIRITPFDWLHPSTPAKLINIIKQLSHGLEKIPFFREFAGSLHIYACRSFEGHV